MLRSRGQALGAWYRVNPCISPRRRCTGQDRLACAAVTNISTFQWLRTVKVDLGEHGRSSEVFCSMFSSLRDPG